MAALHRSQTTQRLIECSSFTLPAPPGCLCRCEKQTLPFDFKRFDSGRKSQKNTWKETKLDLTVIKLSLRYDLVLASLLTNPLDCYRQSVRLLGENRTSAPTVLDSQLKRWRVMFCFLELLRDRKWEESVLEQSSDSPHSHQAGFHSPPQFLSVAVGRAARVKRRL